MSGRHDLPARRREAPNASVPDPAPGVRSRAPACTGRDEEWPARDNLPAAVELARTEAVFLGRYGRRAAVLVCPERYEPLTAPPPT